MDLSILATFFCGIAALAGLVGWWQAERARRRALEQRRAEVLIAAVLRMRQRPGRLSAEQVHG